MTKTITAYKLCRLMKDGTISPLFINKKKRLPLNEWMEAESHPTKGFAVRPFWHSTAKPKAPHLSKKGRVWCEVQIQGVQEIMRPESQGGKWFLSKRMKLIKILKNVK